MSIQRNFLYNLLLRISNVIVPLITFPYVARILGPSGFGAYSFSLSTLNYFILMVAMGIPIYGMREVASLFKNKKELNLSVTELLVLNFLSSLVGAGILIFLIFYVPVFYEVRNLMMYAIPVVLLSFLNIEWFYKGAEDFKFIALRTITIRLASILAIFIFIQEESDFVLYFLITCISYLLGFVLNISFIHKYKIKPVFPGKNFLRKHGKPVLILFASVVAVTIYTELDTIMLGFLSNHESVGLYSSSVKIIRVLTIGVTSLAGVLLPRLVKELKEKSGGDFHRLLNQSYRYIVFATVPLVFCLSIAAENVIIAYIGDEFLESYLVLIVLSPMLILIGLSNIFSVQILIPHHQEKIFTTILWVGAVFNFSLNLLLIPKYLHYGAAFSTLATEMIVTIVSYFIVKKKFKINFDLSILAKNILVCLPFVGFHYLIEIMDWNAIVKLLSFLLLAGIYYLAIHFFVLNVFDLRMTIQSFKEKI